MKLVVNIPPEAVFIFTSTNKVYGDNPNRLPLRELKTRWELPKTHKFYKGIDETMSLDYCTHSIFGVSKVSADLMVQEYGRYFGIKTGVFRGGCLTGPAHSAAQLHGFLAYLVHAIAKNIPYTVFGYKGKQVRDNIHSYDVVNAFYNFYLKPRTGEVYNIGGSRYSNISVNEAIPLIEKYLKKKAKIKYDPTNRIGDHIWYISNVSKFKKHYPKWEYTYNAEQIIEELCMYSLPEGKRQVLKHNMNKKLKILVTGGAGFIGSFLVDELIEKGYVVRIFDNLEKQVHNGKKPSYLNPKAEFIKGDVRNRTLLLKAINGIDAIYHLAATVGVAQSNYQIKNM